DGPALSAEQVKELQAKYAAERAAADKDGLTKVFSPDWYARAEGFAKKGDAALAAGRLGEARDAFTRARWQLPAPPPGLPPHVARVFGDGKLRHGNEVLCVAYSPDGTKLASASRDGTAKVWDAQTGRELLCLTGHGGEAVRAVAFSPDGKHLATAGGDNKVKLSEVATGKDVRTYKDARTYADHSEAVYSLAFSPDGRWLATGEGHK